MATEVGDFLTGGWGRLQLCVCGGRNRYFKRKTRSFPNPKTAHFVAAGRDGVETFVRVTPLDIFKGYDIQLCYGATKIWHFEPNAMFFPTKWFSCLNLTEA